MEEVDSVVKNLTPLEDLSPGLFSGTTLCAIREKIPINQEVQPGGRHNHEKLWIECIEFTETSH